MLLQNKCENHWWAFVSYHIYIQLSRFSRHLISDLDLGSKITEMWTYPRILETAPLAWILKSYVTLFWGYDIQDKTNQWLSSAGWRLLWTVLKRCFNRFLKKKWTKIKQPCLKVSRMLLFRTLQNALGRDGWSLLRIALMKRNKEMKRWLSHILLWSKHGFKMATV